MGKDIVEDLLKYEPYKSPKGVVMSPRGGGKLSLLRAEFKGMYRYLEETEGRRNLVKGGTMTRDVFSVVAKEVLGGEGIPNTYTDIFGGDEVEKEEFLLGICSSSKPVYDEGTIVIDASVRMKLQQDDTLTIAEKTYLIGTCSDEVFEDIVKTSCREWDDERKVLLRGLRDYFHHTFQQDEVTM